MSVPAQIMRKMAATVGTVPYDMLAEFGHSYNPTLIAAADPGRFARRCTRLRRCSRLVCSPCWMSCGASTLDHPDAQRAIEEIKAILKPTATPLILLSVTSEPDFPIDGLKSI